MPGQWGADVPVSRPAPPKVPGLVDVGGFAFTANGIAHDLTEEEAEDIFTPTYSPAEEAGA